MDNWKLIAALAVGLALGVLCAGTGIWLYMRRKYVAFTESICKSIDILLKRQSTAGFDTDEDTLLSKTQMKLKQLEGITAAAARESEEQKGQMQSIVSDISHQLKTPIANISMYCNTAVREELSEESRKECLCILGRQVNKLDALIQSLLQMSRLENNIISLHPKENNICNMLFEVIESIRLKAERKGQSIHLECPETETAYFDEKWTSEAIFNIMDNAVKYTPEGGEIRILAEPLEIYTKITAEDTGIGILPEHINDVCKRFFREERAAGTEGVGIGLYLTREIVMKQSGYLRIQSKEGQGSKVSVYLLKQGRAAEEIQEESLPLR